ncbi:MAG: transglutaminase-like domain-containing protein [Planctomycetota bacterium]
MTEHRHTVKAPPARRTGAFIAFVMAVLLACGISIAGPDEGPEKQPERRTVDLTYAFVVQDLPKDAQDVSAWIPMPRNDDHQTLHGYSVETDHSATATKTDELGNRYLRFDLSDAGDNDGAHARAAVTFTVTRTAYRALDGEDAETASDQEVARRYLSPNRLIPLGGSIAREARRVAGQETGNVPRARRLYNHIVETMTYDKTGEGWGRGDAMYACSVRKGNCTDFHSLFIGEARALDIPARFVMGLPLPPDKPAGKIDGYHCWAQFHAPGHSWIPLDASEASKRPEVRDERFGGLDANRVSFTIGRDITIPGTTAGPQNYVIYPHVEVDGSVWDDVSTTLQYRDVAPPADAEE